MEIKELKPFFEDTTLDLSMREYARLMKIGTRHATTILKSYTKENILIRTTTGPRSPYKINPESPKARSLAQLYWQGRLTNLVQAIKDKINPTGIVLVNEFTDLTNTKDTKITIFLCGTTNQSLNRTEYVKELGRQIQLIAGETLIRFPAAYKLKTANGFLLSGKIV